MGVVAPRSRIRRAIPDDAEACHGVMWASVTDLGSRHGTPLPGTAAEWWVSGRVAVLDPADLPDILLHVEGRALALGLERLELQVPAPNEVAARHLLGRGFRLDPWVNLLMSNRPFGRFDRLISFGPPLFL